MDIVLTMSEYLRQSFINGFGVAPEKVVNVGGAINQTSLPEIPPDKAYDSCELLFVGVEFERKGGKQLLKAFGEVIQKFPKAKLHIVGPGLVAIPTALQNNVELHGFLRKSDANDWAKLSELYRRCSVLVLPSLYEPFGIAPLEGMVHGLACVVTDGWALREMVRHGVNGELVERGNADDLAAKMISLLSRPDEIQRMGRTGRQIVIEKYTWAAVAKRIGRAAEFSAAVATY